MLLNGCRTEVKQPANACVSVIQINFISLGPNLYDLLHSLLLPQAVWQSGLCVVTSARVALKAGWLWGSLRTPCAVQPSLTIAMLGGAGSRVPPRTRHHTMAAQPSRHSQDGRSKGHCACAWSLLGSGSFRPLLKAGPAADGGRPRRAGARRASPLSRWRPCSERGRKRL